MSRKRRAKAVTVAAGAAGALDGAKFTKTRFFRATSVSIPMAAAAVIPAEHLVQDTRFTTNLSPDTARRLFA